MNSDQTSWWQVVLKKSLAEALGAFAIVFGGCGAIIANQVSQGEVTHVGVSLCFGLIVASMIYALGHVSGAHFNPAVTIAFWVAGHFPFREVIPYVVAQFFGGWLASQLHFFLLSDHLADLNYGVTQPFDGLYTTALYWEFILTFLLMFVIMAVSTDSRAIKNVAGLSVGAVVAFEALFAGPFSGASMNPARSWGPALVSGNTEHLSAYILAPILGAIFGGLFYHRIKCSVDSKSEIKGCC